MASKQRDTRLLELTAKELGALPAETQVYEGVGKMCVKLTASPENRLFAYLSTGRFVAKPSADVQKRLAAETEGLRNDVAGLNKKLNYLETTHRNSQQHIDRILNSGGR